MTNKKVPMRQCVGCNEMKSKREMIRVIKTAEEEVLLDTTGKKNGRGAYLCPCSVCLEKARKSRGLERSLKMTIPEEIYESLQKEMKSIENG
ncbi:MAG: YlxR family protein [Lachnospiraceae bacterium]|nr:YlxR family protein [Lachnospiraceae bacterium]MDD7379339.1 YlxR family protein [Lachnospiraceae bacterium]MDY4617110.1 YlxR family protein [Lachnospiraceae bacterium]MDY5774628.1 YlxR family protein [Lachnospiraceae bacterium]